MKAYQVLNWDEHFENSKSRERDSCGFVCVPNKQHGMGLTFILSLDDGAAIYGIWNLIIGALSRQPRPRAGWLTDDGREQGRPWTVGDLALRWRRPADEVARALETLCCDKVCWMRQLDRDAGEGARQVPADYPPTALEGKRREEKRREAPAAQAFCVVPAVAAPTPPPDPSLLTFPTVKGKRTGTIAWGFTQGFHDELREGFPTLDVMGEARKALAWCRANPSRQKTGAGMKAFLFSWMQRAQNGRRGGRVSRDEELQKALQSCEEEPF